MAGEEGGGCRGRKGVVGGWPCGGHSRHGGLRGRGSPGAGGGGWARLWRAPSLRSTMAATATRSSLRRRGMRGGVLWPHEHCSRWPRARAMRRARRLMSPERWSIACHVTRARLCRGSRVCVCVTVVQSYGRLYHLVDGCGCVCVDRGPRLVTECRGGPWPFAGSVTCRGHVTTPYVAVRASWPNLVVGQLALATEWLRWSRPPALCVCISVCPLGLSRVM